MHEGEKNRKNDKPRGKTWMLMPGTNLLELFIADRMYIH